MRGFIGLYGENVMAYGREVTMLWRPERRQAAWGLVVLLSAVWLIGQAAAWLWAAWSMVRLAGFDLLNPEIARQIHGSLALAIGFDILLVSMTTAGFVLLGHMVVEGLAIVLCPAYDAYQDWQAAKAVARVQAELDEEFNAHERELAKAEAQQIAEYEKRFAEFDRMDEEFWR